MLFEETISKRIDLAVVGEQIELVWTVDVVVEKKLELKTVDRQIALVVVVSFEFGGTIEMAVAMVVIEGRIAAMV